MSLVFLIAALIALTALALWLDHCGIDISHWFGTTDPRDVGERGRRR